MLRADQVHVRYHRHSMLVPALLHLTDLLPGVAGGVELKDISRSALSSCKYIPTPQYNKQYKIH